jgi:PAS domain S-box-containing protein
MDLSLRIKLIIIFLIVTLLAVGIVSLLNINSTGAALTEQTNENMKALAASEASVIADVLAKRVEAMQAFAWDEDAQAGVMAQNAAYSGGREAILAELAELDEQWVAAGNDDALIQERLSSELAHELDNLTLVVPDFAEAFITDRYGGLVATSDRTSDYYQADEGWWQAAYNDGQGAVYIGLPELDESTGVIGVNIAVPLYSQGNEIVGVMRTTLDVTALVARLAIMELGETGGADLLLGEELFEAHHEGHAYEGDEHHALDPATLAQIETAPAGYVATSFEGQPSLVGYAAIHSPTGEQFISDLGWKVIVHQARSEALATVGAQTRSTLVTASLIGAIAIAIAIGMGQFLANPIARLTSMVTKFTEGDLSARVDIDSRDETGVLATSFNQMAEQVGNLLTDVQARSAELEERTRELEASQRVTFAASERVSPDALLGLVVNLIRDQFDLYHVQVYIVDEEQEAAVLRESTGYAGRQLLQQKHHIPLDRPALVTKAIHEGQPVLVADVNQAEDWLPNPLLPDTQSELVVPLKIGERVIGALDAQGRTAGRFSESTVALFQTMTDQITFLFENSELVERVTEQTETTTLFANQLRTAADIARRLGTILDPERLLQQMVEMLQSRFGLYHAHIYVLDEETGELTVQAGSGEVGRVLRERGHGIALDAEKSLVARAAREQGAVVVDDVSLVSDFMPNPLLPQTRSEMAVPLAAGDKVLGVLDVQDDRPHRFTEADVNTFSTLAGQLATALQNAHLFEQVEANAQQAQVRFEVGQALTSAQTEEEVLDVLIQQMGIYPNARPSIFTVVPEAEELTVTVRRQATLDSGLPPLEEGMRLPVSRFPSLQDSAEGKPFMSANLLQDESVDPAVREIARMTGALSELSLPLMAGGEYLGVISASSPEEGFFDERKLHLYRTLAEQGTVALQAARLRDATQESEKQYRELLGTLRDGFAVINLEGQITDCNAAFEAISGYTLEELKAMTLFDLTPEKWHAMETQILEEQVMTRGYSDLYQKEYIHKDGTIFPVELAVYLVRDKEGNPVGFWGFIRDITVRKQAQEEQQKLAAVVRYSSELVNLSTPDGKMVFLNEAGSKMLGIDPEEVEQYGIPHVIPEELLPKVQEEVLPSIMEQGNWEGELQYHNVKTGELTDVHAMTFMITDPSTGAPLYLANVSLDITERKQAEETLRENEERLDLALEAADAGVWEFWPLADKAYFSDRWFTMLGYGPDELPHSYATWASLLHPDDLGPTEQLVNQCVQKGKDFVTEFRMKTKDGGWRWIHDIAKTVETNEDGVTTRMLGTHTDITESKLAEMERERFTTQLRTAADLAEQINAILDPDELLSEVVTQLQDRFDLYHVHIYVLDEETHDLNMRAGSGEVGQTMLERGHSIPLDREQSLVARAARTRKIVSVADTSLAPDFMTNPLLPDTRSEVAVPLVAGDKVLGVLDVQDDQPQRFTPGDLSVFSTLAGQIATALENAAFVEEVQQTAEQLCEVDRLKSEFMSSMSHELRTPLNSILGYTEVMLMGIDGELPSETMEDIQVIHENGQHLLNLINDILDLAKIEAGTMTLNLEAVEIAPLLEGVKTNNAGLLLNKPIEMVVEAEKGLPTIQADEVRLNQVLNNLVGNAVKFTEEGNITLRAFSDNGWLCIDVTDTGIGISDEDVQKIFDRFTQADSSNARRAQGTGLGLAITLHLVQMHGGTIDVQSRPGEGSTFTVRLPIDSD